MPAVGTARFVLFWWIVLFGWWIVLVGTTAWLELVADRPAGPAPRPAGPSCHAFGTKAPHTRARRGDTVPNPHPPRGVRARA
jgi:hypothetical protein